MQLFGILVSIITLPFYLWVWGNIKEEVFSKINNIGEKDPKWIAQPLATTMAILIMIWPWLTAAGVASLFGLGWSDIFGK